MQGHDSQLESLRRKVQQFNMIDLTSKQVGTEQIMMLNLKLREDLTACFQNYIRIMTAADMLQRENTDLTLKVERATREDKSQIHALSNKVIVLEGHLAERDAKMRVLQGSYELSETAETNHWTNLFVDRSAAVAAISRDEIRAWTRENNFCRLAPRLREAGFDDGEILELNQVSAYFAYANRTVLGLGITTAGDIIGLSPGDSSDPDNWSHQ